VFEFGPDRDDALTVTGNSQVLPSTLTFKDSDMAVTGGTGQFFGAYGDMSERAHRATNNTVESTVITFYVPSNRL
jgi:hypothetical protein